jgi:hypothetical protein
MPHDDDSIIACPHHVNGMMHRSQGAREGANEVQTRDKGKESKEGRADTRQEKCKVVRKDGRKLLHRGADEER